MDKKRSILLIKKIAAFIIDICIFILLIFICYMALFLFYRISIIEKIIDILMFVFYFYLTPKLFGNTLGRKLLRINDKFTMRWHWAGNLQRKAEEQCWGFPNKHFKKDVILKVSVQNGCWNCPSCNDTNQEIYDVCGNCGQEVEKNNK